MPGKLFVVATPLGNLDDLSTRALSTLAAVDAILCEDTRQTAKLLARFDLHTPTLSCHAHNEPQRLEAVVQRLHAGENLALVSDAGTPGISDPGALLVRGVLTAGLSVCPIPGPSAVAALLSVCGLAVDRFVFEGFLPQRSGERRRRLRQLIDETRPIVCFESPHRIVKSLRDIGEVLGERRMVIGRELTKVHESILCGEPSELSRRFNTGVRGELTLVLSGAGEPAPPADLDAQGLRRRWESALSAHAGQRRDALRALARELGLKRAELYRRVVELEADAD